MMIKRCSWTNEHMNNKFRNFKINFFEILDRATCKVLKFRFFKIIIIIMAKMVKVLQ
jgi:hypothetical protein